MARDPSDVLTLSRPSHFVQGEPQDSAEYLNHLLDCLHEEELKAMPQQQHHQQNEEASTNTSLVRRLFGGTLSRRTVCAACQHVSSVELEDFICLFLPLDGGDSAVSQLAASR